MAEDPTPEWRPRELHRRTWELELLISGAIVVALLSLPGAVDAVYERLAPHASKELHSLIWIGYYPAKLILAPAILIFAFHILVRGLWVGLVGLNAVFPEGVRWERLDLGPAQRRFLSERVSPVRFQEQVDRVASTLFSILFSVLALTLGLGLWFAVAIVASLALRALGVDVPIGQLAQRTYFVTLLLIFGPGVVSTLLDRILERRGREAGGLARLSRALYGFFWFATFGYLWYPALGVLQSNLARRKVAWWKGALWGAPIGIVLALTVIVPFLAPRIVSRLDSYVWSPTDPAEQGMLRRHYDALRVADGPHSGAERPQRVPSIPTDAPQGPWLRLYLPYRASDNPRLAEVCGNREPFRADGDVIAAFQGRSGDAAARRAALACFGRLWTVALDGAPLSALEMLFADGPDGRSRGVVTYLDLRGLAPGRHDLLVERRPTDEERADSDFDPEDSRYHIPFWR